MKIAVLIARVLLGLVFLNLTLAFFVRYIRSRRPMHAVLFWTCGAAAILTHAAAWEESAASPKRRSAAMKTS